MRVSGNLAGLWEVVTVRVYCSAHSVYFTLLSLLGKVWSLKTLKNRS
uniref:Uncharacterized protein n=1 Tax=Anguilla anguilla TaxID=7936 RepID=A0A0E9Q6G9_ANGAN